MKSSLKYVILLSFFIICFIFNISNTNALTTTTIYSDINNSGTLINSNKFLYSSSSLGLLFDSSTGSINTKYETACYGLQFWFSQAITTSNTYTIQLNFNDYDIYESVSTNYVQVYVYNNDEPTQASLLSVSKTNKNTQYKTLIIKYVSSVPGTKVRVSIEKVNTDGSYARILGPLNFRLNSVQVDSSQAEGNEQIIINNNQNTQNIINNQEQNTQNIINNQNQNTQQQIDSQKVCSTIDKTNIEIDNKYLNSNGNQDNSPNYGITSYQKINKDTIIKVLTSLNSDAAKYCFYNTNKELISCHTISSSLVDTELDIPNNSEYFRTSIQKALNKPTFEICKNGNQAVSDSVNDLNDSINNSDVDNSDAVSFFNDFTDNTHGLSGIITAPLNAINQMLSNTCNPLSATYQGKTVELACGYEFWNKISVIRQFLNIVLDGLICYRILVKLFKMIERLKNPEDDRVEVMDL